MRSAPEKWQDRGHTSPLDLDRGLTGFRLVDVMRPLFRAYLKLTHFFGKGQRLVRRLAALCLVVMGVHAAGDHIDDLVFAVVDRADLWGDQLFWRLCDWGASLGAFSVNAANRYAQNFATWIDLDEKATLSMVAALGVELLIDLLLLDFVWGNRIRAESSKPTSLKEELKQSAKELADAFWPLDLERLAILPVLIAFVCAGTFMAGLAIENAVGSTLGNALPLWRWGINTAAASGLLAAALLLWRFLPELLHGAALRARERADAFNERHPAPEAEQGTPRLARLRAKWVRLRRGWFIALVMLPLALLGLFTQSAFLNLVARTGANL